MPFHFFDVLYQIWYPAAPDTFFHEAVTIRFFCFSLIEATFPILDTTGDACGCITGMIVCNGDPGINGVTAPGVVIGFADGFTIGAAPGFSVPGIVVGFADGFTIGVASGFVDGTELTVGNAVGIKVGVGLDDSDDSSNSSERTQKSQLLLLYFSSASVVTT